MPSIIVLNLSNDGYFLPPIVMETEQHLMDFLNGVLDKSFEVREDKSSLLNLIVYTYVTRFEFMFNIHVSINIFNMSIISLHIKMVTYTHLNTHTQINT